MPSLTAHYADQRVLFTARGRSVVNVRELQNDQAIGLTSTELLLVALANCSTGTLIGYEAVRNAGVVSVSSSLEADMEATPPRVRRVRARIQLEVEDPAGLDAEELAEVAARSPMFNSINADSAFTVEINAARPNANPQGRESIGAGCTA